MLTKEKNIFEPGERASSWVPWDPCNMKGLCYCYEVVLVVEVLVSACAAGQLVRIGGSEREATGQRCCGRSNNFTRRWQPATRVPTFMVLES